MNVTIKSVRDAGNIEKERIVLRVSAETDIGRFAVFQAMASGNGELRPGSVPHAYWFEDQRVSVGDLVVLYTKAGVTSQKKNGNGTVSRFFYWNLDKPVWVRGYVPVLVLTSNWEMGEFERED